MKALNKYLLILLGCFMLFTSCQICEKLGIVEKSEKSTQKVVGGKIVETDSDGEAVSPSSKLPKINVGYLVWWAAVFASAALVIRFFARKHNERRQ
jgi:amino acid transporter